MYDPTADLEKQRAEKMEAESKYRQDQMQNGATVGYGQLGHTSLVDCLRRSVCEAEQKADKAVKQQELLRLLEAYPDVARILDLLQLVG